MSFLRSIVTVDHAETFALSRGLSLSYALKDMPTLRALVIIEMEKKGFLGCIARSFSLSLAVSLLCLLSLLLSICANYILCTLRTKEKCKKNSFHVRAHTVYSSQLFSRTHIAHTQVPAYAQRDLLQKNPCWKPDSGLVSSLFVCLTCASITRTCHHQEGIQPRRHRRILGL